MFHDRSGHNAPLIALPSRLRAGAVARPLSVAPDRAPFVTPDLFPGSIHGPRCRRSRWGAGSAAGAAARTEAGPRIGAGAPSGVTSGEKPRAVALPPAGPPPPAPAAGASLSAGIAASWGSVAVIVPPCSDRERVPVSARILRGRPRLPGRVSAPARFARLIARARQRAHSSRRLLTCFQKPAPLGRATPGKRLRSPLPWGPSYHNPPDVKLKTRTKSNFIRFFSVPQKPEGPASRPRLIGDEAGLRRVRVLRRRMEDHPRHIGEPTPVPWIVRRPPDDRAWPGVWCQTAIRPPVAIADRQVRRPAGPISEGDHSLYFCTRSLCRNRQASPFQAGLVFPSIPEVSLLRAPDTNLRP